MNRKILQFILKILAQLVLWKYQPMVIGITGSVGKTSTKEAVYRVVSSHTTARRNRGNYNNEIGVPLTILDAESAGRSISGWLRVFFKAGRMIIFRVVYPKVLILEMGADKPGDIEYLMKFITCQIGIVTAMGEIPVHVEFFKSPVQIAREKARLVESISPQGWVILNYDDEAVSRMKEKSQARVLTFGFEKGADVQAINYEMKDLTQGGVSFKINYKGSVVPIKMNKILGRQQVYAALAAISAGVALGVMNLVEISQILQEYQSPAGRMRLLKGIKKTWLIDDSYNASPVSTKEALKTLRDLAGFGQRKIAVLGDMLELGQYTERAHRQIGGLAAQIVDLFFTVGERARFMAQEALKQGLSRDSIFEFDTAEEVKKAVQEHLREGDIVLIKGSRAMRMERVVEELILEPLKAKELLIKE